MRKKNDGQMGGRSALPVPCMSLLDTKQPMPPADRHKFAVVGWVRASPGMVQLLCTYMNILLSRLMRLGKL